MTSAGLQQQDWPVPLGSQSSTAAPVPAMILAWCAAVLLAPLPLAIKLGESLWQREQYQFFPMILAGAAWLAWERWQELPAQPFAVGSRRVTWGLGTLGLLVLIAGTLLYVRSAAGVTVILLLIAIAWRIGSWTLLQAMVGPLVLLATIVPPPGREDQAITLRLQQWAVTLSSRWLDVLHVPNVRSGSVIEIPGRRLFIEQACSGINSLMSVLAFSILFGLWKHRPAWRIAALLPVAALFVLGGNVLRITLEAWLKVRWHIDVLEGSVHQLLGILVFAACVGLVISFDALLSMAERDGAVRGRTVATAPATKRRIGFSPKMPDWIFAGLCVIAAIWVQSQIGSAWASATIRPDAKFTMPDQLAGWTKVSQGAVFIERPQTQAAKSFVWNFRQGDVVASVAIDYPFSGFHELTTCYAASGWTIGKRVAVDDDTGPDGYLHVRLNKPATNVEGDLCFTLLDEQGHTVSEPTLRGNSRLPNSLRVTRRFGQAVPAYQVQTLVQSYLPISQTRRTAAGNLFMAARKTLTAQMLAQLENPPAGASLRAH